MEKIAVYYFLFINFITILIFYIDKQKAKNRGNRISEKTLLTCCIIGGSLGGFAAIHLFRHKTTKRSFLLPFYFIAMLHIGLIYGYAHYYG
ncbi:DUF1294 domain-containing protein [Sphingobacterium faecium]|uniref:DUF1294 domain-containing protein n=1 Tax=Sphingobacterium faecium TaxID=34087 RepID=UPI001291B6EE|nr:DUF1294 domain-containing protein [Sphingobacterium faecium]MQP25972.1 DUF1294 domain-containing protein [Sphingobacterium faecium]